MIQLEPIDSGCALPDHVTRALMQIDENQRERLLRQVAALGVDLLRGDRVLSEEASQASTTAPLITKP